MKKDNAKQSKLYKLKQVEVDINVTLQKYKKALKGYTFDEIYIHLKKFKYNLSCFEEDPIELPIKHKELILTPNIESMMIKGLKIEYVLETSKDLLVTGIWSELGVFTQTSSSSNTKGSNSSSTKTKKGTHETLKKTTEFKRRSRKSKKARNKPKKCSFIDDEAEEGEESEHDEESDDHEQDQDCGRVRRKRCFRSYSSESSREPSPVRAPVRVSARSPSVIVLDSTSDDEAPIRKPKPKPVQPEPDNRVSSTATTPRPSPSPHPQPMTFETSVMDMPTMSLDDINMDAYSPTTRDLLVQCIEMHKPKPSLDRNEESDKESVQDPDDVPDPSDDDDEGNTGQVQEEQVQPEEQPKKKASHTYRYLPSSSPKPGYPLPSGQVFLDIPVLDLGQSALAQEQEQDSDINERFVHCMETTRPKYDKVEKEYNELLKQYNKNNRDAEYEQKARQTAAEMDAKSTLPRVTLQHIDKYQQDNPDYDVASILVDQDTYSTVDPNSDVAKYYQGILKTRASLVREVNNARRVNPVNLRSIESFTDYEFVAHKRRPADYQASCAAVAKEADVIINSLKRQDKNAYNLAPPVIAIGKLHTPGKSAEYDQEALEATKYAKNWNTYRSLAQEHDSLVASKFQEDKSVHITPNNIRLPPLKIVNIDPYYDLLQATYTAYKPVFVTLIDAYNPKTVDSYYDSPWYMSFVSATHVKIGYLYAKYRQYWNMRVKPPAFHQAKDELKCYPEDEYDYVKNLYHGYPSVSSSSTIEMFTVPQEHPLYFAIKESQEGGDKGHTIANLHGDTQPINVYPGDLIYDFASMIKEVKVNRSNRINKEYIELTVNDKYLFAIAKHLDKIKTREANTKWGITKQHSALVKYQNKKFRSLDRFFAQEEIKRKIIDECTALLNVRGPRDANEWFRNRVNHPYVSAYIAHIREKNQKPFALTYENLEPRGVLDPATGSIVFPDFEALNRERTLACTRAFIVSDKILATLSEREIEVLSGILQLYFFLRKYRLVVLELRENYTTIDTSTDHDEVEIARGNIRRSINSINSVCFSKSMPIIRKRLADPAYIANNLQVVDSMLNHVNEYMLQVHAMTENPDDPSLVPDTSIFIREIARAIENNTTVVSFPPSRTSTRSISYKRWMAMSEYSSNETDTNAKGRAGDQTYNYLNDIHTISQDKARTTHGELIRLFGYEFIKEMVLLYVKENDMRSPESARLIKRASKDNESTTLITPENNIKVHFPGRYCFYQQYKFCLRDPGYNDRHLKDWAGVFSSMYPVLASIMVCNQSLAVVQQEQSRKRRKRDQGTDIPMQQPETALVPVPRPVPQAPQGQDTFNLDGLSSVLTQADIYTTTLVDRATKTTTTIPTGSTTRQVVQVAINQTTHRGVPQVTQLLQGNMYTAYVPGNDTAINTVTNSNTTTQKLSYARVTGANANESNVHKLPWYTSSSASGSLLGLPPAPDENKQDDSVYKHLFEGVVEGAGIISTESNGAAAIMTSSLDPDGQFLDTFELLGDGITDMPLAISYSQLEALDDAPQNQDGGHALP